MVDPEDRIISYYYREAKAVIAQYDSLDAAQVHRSWLPLLAEISTGKVLDAGAGSGRDARWLQQQGWQVTAVEPAAALRQQAETHPDNGAICWHNARLPELAGLQEQYDLILLSAVWMHLSVAQRQPALQRLVQLLAPQGWLVITLRHGPTDAERPMYPVSVAELRTLAEPLQLDVFLLEKNAKDCLNRASVWWQTVVVKHPSWQVLH
ncbi:MAG: class I SAM-dependent methyltransferase [Marinobacterium sp.]|nr:class I SAM-dependent methyltransferase [Marinobacterium sp.]